MQVSSFHNVARLSVADNNLVNELIDRFEESRSDEEPSIEEVLLQAPENVRAQLLYELLLIELARVGGLRESMNRQRLIDRFHAHTDAVVAALTDHKTNQSYVPQVDRNGVSSKSSRPEIPGFEIVKSLGEGGMGKVWLAQQFSPVKRTVAIKVIKRGMDSHEIVSRFDAEAQAIARLDHRGIATIHDRGFAEDGRPYFTMQFIDGLPITDHCRENHLSINDKLNLFLAVCDAVFHAHQRGIIHRDLKPSNLLVSNREDEPSVVVIDFGLAKAIQGERLTSQTLYTGHGQVMGTIHYMSPEQASGDADIDTRTDVYSLGVVLYEILTGQNPLDVSLSDQENTSAVLNWICNSTPAKPSSKLASRSTVRAEDADTREDVERMRLALKVDLDWIVMKALEKDRTRRYESVHAFAEDIRRYLKGDPVEACPPSRGYRFRKFINRNAGVVTAFTAIAAVLVVGAGVSTYFAVAYRHSAGIAKSEKKAAEIAAEKSRWQTYAAKIMRADSEWARGDGETAIRVLESTEPSFRSWEYGFLRNAMSAHQLSSFFPNKRSMGDIVVTAEGRRMFTVGADSRVGIWGMREFVHRPFELERMLPLASRLANQILVTHDERTLIYATQTNEVGWLNLRTDSEEHSVKFDEPVHAILMHPNDQLFVVATGRTLRVFNVDDPQFSKPTTIDFPFLLWDVAFSPDGRKLAVGGRELLLYDVHVQDGPTLTVSNVASAKVPRRAVVSLSFSPDGRSIACGDNRGILGLRSADDLSVRFETQAHADDIRSICFSHDGSQLLTGSADKTAIVWDATDGSIRVPLKGHFDDVTGATFLADDRVATVSLDTSIRFWILTPKPIVQEIGGHIHAVSCVSVSPDQTLLASADSHSNVRIHSLRENLLVRNLSHPKPVSFSSLAFDPRGERLAVSSGHQIFVWDVETGEQLQTLSKHTDNVLSVCFSHDGTRLATAGRDHTTMIWDTATWKPWTFDFKHPDVVREVRFVGGSSQLITACDDSIVRVCNVQSGAVAKLHGHENIVMDVNCSPESRRIASGGKDGLVCIWDLDTYELVHKLDTRMKAVNKVAFNNIGDRLATVGQNGSVRLWSVVSGEELLTIKASAEPIQWVEFTPDGNTIVTGGNDNHVRVWRSAPGQLP